MKRFFLLFLTIGLGLISSAFAADEAVRAVQRRLKEGGFYFGALNGEYDSNTSAAVSRYQIRNGLPITGQLETETTNSLGLAPPEPAAPPPPAGETWRRLRQSDAQFLQRLKRKAPAPATEASPPASDDAGYDSLVVLSPERLRDYVGAFILAGLEPGVNAELEFFAERVAYYGKGQVAHEKIRRDLERYNRRWPERRFWLEGEVSVEPQADSRLRVTFPLRYELRRGTKQQSGKVLKTLIVEVVGEDLQIVGVDERKAK